MNVNLDRIVERSRRDLVVKRVRIDEPAPRRADIVAQAPLERRDGLRSARLWGRICSVGLPVMLF